MACALVASGRHELIAYTGHSIDAAILAGWGAKAKSVGDLEEVLADPAVEAVIVAGTAANRSAQLRRALQSERHVLCVHPPDRTPDAAYEAAMIQADTGRMLFPLLPDATHPALVRLGELLRQADGTLGELRLLEVAHASAGEFLLEADEPAGKWTLPGWDRLCAVGGEIIEVSALASNEDLEPGQPLSLSGVFEGGGLFQVSFLPNMRQPLWRATANGSHGRLELLFPLGWNGPAFLSWRDADGELKEEAYATWDPWPRLVESFETAVGMGREIPRTLANPDSRISRTIQYSVLPAPKQTTQIPIRPSWQDVIRALELDDAARRSVAKRRASTLEFPDATEEAGFKGTMTLVGCGLLWGILLLLVLSAWKPWLGWFIVPVLAVFLLLQGLRWIARRPPE